MYCPRLGRDRQHQAWWGRAGAGRLWLVGITISISLSLKSDGRAYAQCSYPAFTYEIDILCKNIYTVRGGRRRGTHRCRLDNFDSGPHCRAEQSRAERQIRRGNSCRWQQQKHHILIPVPNPVARLSRCRFVALFISLLRELCFCCCFSFCCWCRVVSRLACFVSCWVLCACCRLTDTHTHTHKYTCTRVY